MKSCIYCGSTGPYSDEHALPRCLGVFKGFPLLKDRICKKCNNDIGKLELQFGRSGPEAYFRKFLDIKGRKKHDRINPFLHGSAGAKPIDFKALHPETGIEILWEFNPDGKSIHEVRQIVFIDKEGRTHPFRIYGWMKKVDHLRDEMKKEGLKGKFNAIILAPDNEREWIENLVKGLGSKIKWDDKYPPRVIKKSKIHFTVTDFYFRTIAKIGFHYLLAVSDDYRGDEVYFSGIRNFIRNGDSVEKYITQTHQPILISGYSRLRFNRWGHILFVENVRNQLRCRAQFFIGPEYAPITYLVWLSNRTSVVPGAFRKGHIFYYFKTGEKDEHIGGVLSIRINDVKLHTQLLTSVEKS